MFLYTYYYMSFNLILCLLWNGLTIRKIPIFPTNPIQLYLYIPYDWLNLLTFSTTNISFHDLSLTTPSTPTQSLLPT